LESILKTLGYDVQEEITEWDILEQLREGALDAETALRVLKELKDMKTTKLFTIPFQKRS